MTGRGWATALAAGIAALAVVAWLFAAGGFECLASDALWGPYGMIPGLLDRFDDLLHRQWPAFFFGILLVVVLIYLRFM